MKHGVFAMAGSLAQKADVALNIPRLCLRQSKRINSRRQSITVFQMCCVVSVFGHDAGKYAN
jgi:hypothetical protein